MRSTLPSRLIRARFCSDEFFKANMGLFKIKLTSRRSGNLYCNEKFLTIGSSVRVLVIRFETDDRVSLTFSFIFPVISSPHEPYWLTQDILFILISSGAKKII